ncbi:MAG: sigma-70 family RNA polymerase sigma factor [Planctomycetota bacterium]|nr:sigma-70 family RNA polymerase sigma factor [Planctomycetota bacterium]
MSTTVLNDPHLKLHAREASEPPPGDEVRRRVEALRPLMRRSALAVLRRREDAEDAVQEAVLKLVRNAARFEGGSLEALARTSARRVALDMLARKRPHGGGERFDPPAPERAPALEAAEVRGRLREAIERLPDAQRTVVLLVFQEGLSHAEAARELELSPETLRARLYRARQQLRIWLKDLAP